CGAMRCKFRISPELRFRSWQRAVLFFLSAHHGHAAGQETSGMSRVSHASNSRPSYSSPLPIRPVYRHAQLATCDELSGAPVAFNTTLTGCRVGKLTRLKVGSYKSDGVHKVLEIHGTGGKERPVPLAQGSGEMPGS